MAIRLTPDQKQHLADHRWSVQRPCADSAVLERHGLITIGASRFGEYTRLTDAGRGYLAKNVPGSDRPAPTVFSATTGRDLLRGAAPRYDRKAAKQADSLATGTQHTVITPSAAPLKVKGTTLKPVVAQARPHSVPKRRRASP